MEDKAEKFKRLAEKRTQAILEGIRLLGNLANPSVYEYQAKDITTIFDTISECLRLAEARFQAELKFRTKRKEAFRL